MPTSPRFRRCRLAPALLLAGLLLGAGCDAGQRGPGPAAEPGAVADGSASSTAPSGPGWHRLPASPLTGRTGHSAVWTGQEMVIWGGSRGNRALSDGAAWAPGVGRWRPLPPAPIGGRWGHVAAWTGQEMLVWGGFGGSP